MEFNFEETQKDISEVKKEFIQLKKDSQKSLNLCSERIGKLESKGKKKVKNKSPKAPTKPNRKRKADEFESGEE